MIYTRYISLCALALTALSVKAQDLNTEITVTHEVVPEEQAATRVQVQPVIELPTVTQGRLSAATNYIPGVFTPYIFQLDAAEYAASLTRTPWRGYAALGYGPIYNLAASAGYRFIERDSLRLDAYMQFDGHSYNTDYPSLPVDYDGKVCFRRNTGLVGANTAWQSNVGQLTASLLYQYSDYNFPILDLQTLGTDKYFIRTNVAQATVGWGNNSAKLSYNVAAKYDMILFGKEFANNYRGELGGTILWRSTSQSAWGMDMSFSADASMLGNKNLLHVQPRYVYSGEHFAGSFGVDVDACIGNVATSRRVLVAPDLNLAWIPSQFVKVWLKMYGRTDDNYRGRLLDEQPYLLPGYDTGYSRIYSTDLGLTLGSWRGASVSVFGGYTTAYDWLIPAVESGEMHGVDIKGLHGGVSANYDYRTYLSLNVKAEFAQSPSGDYSKGYALWRDHAKFDLSAMATIRPIDKLSITLGYKLRTGRQKTLGEEKNMDLLKINNLTAGIQYSVTSQWSVFLKGENLMNRQWYLGPAVPCQGIMGLIGATYKF